jgi:hypothetical protein
MTISQYHNITTTSSQHHNITTSHHHTTTPPHHHIIEPSHHHNTTPSHTTHHITHQTSHRTFMRCSAASASLEGMAHHTSSSTLHTPLARRGSGANRGMYSCSLSTSKRATCGCKERKEKREERRGMRGERRGGKLAQHHNSLIARQHNSTTAQQRKHQSNTTQYTTPVASPRSAWPRSCAPRPARCAARF